MAETLPRWHPFLAASERTPGVWTLVDSAGHDYGTVRKVRVGAEVGYLGTFRAVPIGRYTTLCAAPEKVHLAFVRAHAPGGAPNGGRG